MGRTAIRLACEIVSMLEMSESTGKTYVFDIGARVDGYDIAVLDPQVVANNTVYPCRTVIEVVVGEYDQDRVLSLLSLDENGVTAEELERLHGVVGKGDD